MSARKPRSATRPRATALIASTVAHHAELADPTRAQGDGLDTEAPNPVFADTARRQAMIAEAAYFRAEHRGFEPGHELEDWCDAEREIDAHLFRGDVC